MRWNLGCMPEPSSQTESAPIRVGTLPGPGASTPGQTERTCVPRPTTTDVSAQRVDPASMLQGVERLCGTFSDEFH